MRIAHFLQVARIAQRHGMTNVLKYIEDDLVAAFRKAINAEIKQKSVEYHDVYSGVTHTFPIPTREIMKYMPSQKLEAVKQYRALAECSLMQAKKIIEDYAHHLHLPQYVDHVPSGYCTFE